MFIEDAASALVTLAHAAPARGEAYNLASGRPTSLEELATLLVEAAGAEVDTHFSGELRSGDPVRWDGDPSLAAGLGARCDTPLSTGLARTAEWIVRSRESDAVV